MQLSSCQIKTYIECSFDNTMALTAATHEVWMNSYNTGARGDAGCGFVDNTQVGRNLDVDNYSLSCRQILAPTSPSKNPCG